MDGRLTRRRWFGGALAGIGAGALSLGLAEVVAGIVAPASAPLIALGDVAVDAVPPWLKDWAVQNFGTHDKQVLLGGALTIALLLSALAGIFAVRGKQWGTWLVLFLGGMAALAAATRPDSTTLSVLPSLAGAMVGMFVLNWLAPQIRQAVDAPGGSRSAELSRRRALQGIGGVLVGGVVTGGLGRALGGRLRGAQASRQSITLPTATDPAPALPSGVSVGVPGVTPFITSNEDFYRIDTALITPLLRADDWSLRIHGMVEREITITYADLLKSALVERDVTLMCVSNEVGGDLTGNARWLGLPIGPLLTRAGPKSTADMVLSKSSDGFTAGTPLEVLTDGRDALLAIGMNGVPLPVEHGFPVRMVVPGLYGYVSATKWVVDLEVTRFDQAEGYWTPRGWSARGPVKTESRFDVPQDLDRVKAGTVVLAGIAWAQHRGVQGVEIRVDDGAWQSATLGAEDSVDTWRQWFFRWNAVAGRYRLQVRATDGRGEVQTATVAATAPDGASGYHTIDVTVE
ncbi:MAG TPA: molybdopterin-dependent oxidoreductase [Kineosporiaceae bacterium]|nr:molybdopterin-dependent oxidoreductase [Kineosporiaceae bacterium]